MRFSFLFYLMLGFSTMDVSAKYEWLPSESAPKSYPIEIIRGQFLLSNGKSVNIPDKRSVNNGWGEVNSVHVVGGLNKPLPVKLDILWFSYIENQFYSGSFGVPQDKLQTMFSEGVLSHHSDEKISYDTIIVGMAPGGHVSIWASAEAVVTEVSTHQALIKEENWKSLLDNEDITREEYIDMVLEEILSEEDYQSYKKDPKINSWGDLYQNKYTWNPEIKGVEVLSSWMNYFNGEVEYSTSINEDKISRGIPKQIRVNWESKSKTEYTVIIDFDPDEILEVYKKFTAKSKFDEFKLLIEISAQTGAVDVFFQDGEFIIKLEKINQQLYKV